MAICEACRGYFDGPMDDCPECEWDTGLEQQENAEVDLCDALLTYQTEVFQPAEDAKLADLVRGLIGHLESLEEVADRELD